jgi:hypothetical protein
MFGMGAVLLILYTSLEAGAFYVAALPVAALFCALAFYRPYGQTMLSFLIYSVLFLFRPKLYVWRREPPTLKDAGAKKPAAGSGPIKLKNEAPLEDIESLARTLDSEGAQRNEKILELINKNRSTK